MDYLQNAKRKKLKRFGWKGLQITEKKNQTSIPNNDHFDTNFIHKSNPEQTYELFSKTEENIRIFKWVTV